MPQRKLERLGTELGEGRGENTGHRDSSYALGGRTGWGEVRP